MENLLRKNELNEKSKQITEQMLGLSDEDLLNLKNPTEEDINNLRKKISEEEKRNIISQYDDLSTNNNSDFVGEAKVTATESNESDEEFQFDNISTDDDIDDEVIYDLVPLPSRGLMYKNKQSALKVAYLTAEDENIITSPNLLRSGKAIDILVKKKILDTDINYDSLLSCDRDAVIMFLRNTAYGSEYQFKLDDPNTGEEFSNTVDLGTIHAKELKILPDENGEFEFILPNMKKMVKFKYLTVKDETSLLKLKEKKENKKDKIDTTYTDLLVQHVVEFDGNRDKNHIKKRISKLLVRDSKELRKFIKDNQPGLDMEVEVEFPSGGTGKVNMPINASFLWPEL